MRHKTTRDIRRRHGPFFGAVLALILGAIIALPAQAQFGEKIEVDEVLLDVVVTNDQGQVVSGLDKNDFIVREDGEPVEVRDVTFYSNQSYIDAHDRKGGVAINQEATPTNRYFILFFHHQRNLLPRLGANLLDAGRRAEQWVRSSMQPNDFVAVVSYFPKYNLLDFTNDTEALTKTIREAVQGKDFSHKDARTPLGEARMSDNVPAGDVDRIYEALAMTAEAAGEVRGRKNLVLFSIGFGETDRFGFYLPDNRYYPPMIRTLNDNNVAVYPVDLLATDVSPYFRFDRLDHVLARLATDTGGEFYYNFTNYLTPLEQVAEDNDGYYLVSFAPSTDLKSGEYQQVDVEMRNANLKVRTREGYVVGDEYPYADAPGGSPSG